jgi:hypothetical protein
VTEKYSRRRHSLVLETAQNDMDVANAGVVWNDHRPAFPAFPPSMAVADGNPVKSTSSWMLVYTRDEKVLV